MSTYYTSTAALTYETSRAPRSRRVNPLAIAALLAALPVGVLGIALGHAAIARIKETGDRGKALAVAGLAIGYLNVGVGATLIGAILAVATMT